MPEISFPRQQARTQRFTLGVPRAFVVAPSGERVAFLRSPSGTDRATGLWIAEPETGTERLVADPMALLGGSDENLSPQERARRERSREGAAGIVGYSTDRAVRLAAFTLSGRLFVADLVAGSVRELPSAPGVIDPRLSPSGEYVTYTSGGALHIVTRTGDAFDRVLAHEEGITFGVADFIAAEEMQRTRGHWWAPTSDALLVARIDESPVERWHIADPANPDRPAAEIAYPAAGTDNADVSLEIVRLDGSRTHVTWDRAAFPYVVTAHWSSGGAPLVTVQNRAQTVISILTVDASTGATTETARETDPIWLDIVPGGPAWTPDGRLVRVAVRDGRNRLMLGDTPVTGTDLHVRAILDIDAGDILVSASADEPTEVHVYRITYSGTDTKVVRLSEQPGIHHATSGGDVVVLSSASLDRSGRRTVVARLDDDRLDEANAKPIASLAEQPVISAEPELLRLGERRLSAALLFPKDHQPGTRLPVLLDPYGGPHAQRVIAARDAYLASQWLADQGFAVLVVDGRGTPGRDHAWEQAIHHDFAGPTLDDQIDALHAAAADHPDLDLDRVAIRGWSYGGYLAALAVLRRPDVFHAAVVGAPVTDWRLYDTHYTERYLGHPDEVPEVYAANSLCGDVNWRWAEQHRPMMIIHGLADDNVVAAHTLRLSSALLAAGRPHEVLPLSGVTHMTPQEVVAENLLLLQVDFLERALA